jgi:hypothetical protein
MSKRLAMTALLKMSVILPQIPKPRIGLLESRQLISKRAKNDAKTTGQIGQQSYLSRLVTSSIHAANDASRASCHLAKASRQLSPFASA